MTFYFRHNLIKDAFERACVAVMKENRGEVDRVIHSIVGVEYKSCPDTWMTVKAMLPRIRLSSSVN